MPASARCSQQCFNVSTCDKTLLCVINCCVFNQIVHSATADPDYLHDAL